MRTRVSRMLPRLAVLGVLAGLVVGGLHLVRTADRDEFTLVFSEATGLYVGDRVKVLGVTVGDVVAVEPQGDRVAVTVEVEGTPVPADARAAIVAPSLVSGRFVQLAPAYTGGPRLDDGATVDLDRTTVPVSFDQVKQELTDLSTALGPQAPGTPGEDGALAETIRVLEANLSDGSSTQLRDTLTELRAASRTLSGGREDLFSTVENLDSFTRNLVTYDGALRGFTTQLAGASDVLDTNRTQLVAAVEDLQSALVAVGGFVEANRETVTTSVEGLDELAATLAERSNTVASLLHVAPHSIVGLYNTVEDQAVTGRVALGNLDSTAQLLCGAILGVGGSSATCGQALGPLLDLLGLAALPGGSAGAGALGETPGGDGSAGSAPAAPPAEGAGGSGSGGAVPPAGDPATQLGGVGDLLGLLTPGGGR